MLVRGKGRNYRGLEMSFSLLAPPEAHVLSDIGITDTVEVAVSM